MVTNYNGKVTIALANNPGGGTLVGTLTVTVVNGIATFSGLTLNTAGTGYTLTATSGSLTSATTSAFNVTPAATTKLIVATQPPGTVILDDAFGLTIDAEDAYNNLTTSFAGSVSVALANNPGSSTLGGTVTVTAVNGVATFSGLNLNKAGSGYTLKATSGSLTAATTSAFNVGYPGYLPNQIATAYGINQITFGTTSGTGAGQTIAIVDPYNDPNIAGDLAQFDQLFNLPSINLTVVNEQGNASPLPAADTTGGWEWEEVVDVEWTHAIAPGANIILVECNSNYYSDLLPGVAEAAESARRLGRLDWRVGTPTNSAASRPMTATSPRRAVTRV